MATKPMKSIRFPGSEDTYCPVDTEAREKAAAAVKSVNNKTPDAAGNVNVEMDSTTVTAIVDAYLAEHAPKDGQDGGYYTLSITKPDANTMKITFTPSKADMPAVAAQTITLPAGADYVLTEADKADIAEQAAALVDAALLDTIGTGVIT